MSELTLKSEEELRLMREAGRLLGLVFSHLDQRIAPGVSTMAINDWAERYIVDQLQARPASKGQYDYQYVLNASVNHVVCHGIPSEKYGYSVVREYCGHGIGREMHEEPQVKPVFEIFLL